MPYVAMLSGGKIPPPLDAPPNTPISLRMTIVTKSHDMTLVLLLLLMLIVVIFTSVMFLFNDGMAVIFNVVAAAVV